MRVLPRLIVLLALGWVFAILLSESRQLSANQEADPTKVMLLFISLIAVGIAMGVLIALALVPMLGDWVGGFFYNPNEKVEKNPHAEALSLVAQGDYAGAIAAFERIWRANPADTQALNEVVHLYCDKLHEPLTAVELLEQALQAEFPEEETAFIAARLADVYWTHLQDARSARPLLLRVSESMPDSKYAANAMHRLREIDHALGELT